MRTHTDRDMQAHTTPGITLPVSSTVQMHITIENSVLRESCRHPQGSFVLFLRVVLRLSALKCQGYSGCAKGHRQNFYISTV